MWLMREHSVQVLLASFSWGGGSVPTLASWKRCATGSPLCHLLLTFVMIAPVPLRFGQAHRQAVAVSVSAGGMEFRLSKPRRVPRWASGVAGVTGTGTSAVSRSITALDGTMEQMRISVDIEPTAAMSRGGGNNATAGIGQAARQAVAITGLGWAVGQAVAVTSGAAISLFASNFPQWGDRGPGGGTASLRSSLEVTSSTELIGSRYP